MTNKLFGTWDARTDRFVFTITSEAIPSSSPGCWGGTVVVTDHDLPDLDRTNRWAGTYLVCRACIRYRSSRENVHRSHSSYHIRVQCAHNSGHTLDNVPTSWRYLPRKHVQMTQILWTSPVQTWSCTHDSDSRVRYVWSVLLIMIRTLTFGLFMIKFSCSLFTSHHAQLYRVEDEPGCDLCILYSDRICPTFGLYVIELSCSLFQISLTSSSPAQLPRRVRARPWSVRPVQCDLTCPTF